MQYMVDHRVIMNSWGEEMTCKHDQLARSCNICDLENVIDDYRKLHEWIKRRYGEEWTFEMGTGEVVEEILSKFDEIGM
ncbi:hypothetical protein GCM10023310_69530 [Paenibacillus vulneris]